MVDVLLGLQWGDEGKGKVVDFLAKKYDIIARFQGGPNAGHTLYIEDKKVVLHTVPSGIFHAHLMNVIGNGVVLDPVSFEKECIEITSHGIDIYKKVLISERAHLILPTHRLLDKASELQKGNQKIGSTLKGIGPTYMDKTGRNGLRVGDILRNDFSEKYNAIKQKHRSLLQNNIDESELEVLESEFFHGLDTLKKFSIIAVEYWIHEQMQLGKKILAEGAQGTMLDIDFGTYPYVTSSNTITAGLCTGMGIAPQKIGKVYGVSKAYCTRVGSGPFPTELHDALGDELRKIGNEYGSTTGRPRRCGWIDLVALKYACMLNGVDELVITKADVLDGFEEINICTSYKVNNKITTQFPYEIQQETIQPIYEQLQGWKTKIATVTTKEDIPLEFNLLIQKIEIETNTKVTTISNGVGREQLIHL